MAFLEDHRLFYRKGCPFCAKVLHFLSRHNVEMELCDADDAKIGEELIRIGGKKQVPCLVVDGNPMYESSDIIAYLKKEIS